jgi:conjugal transfer mating pair stabilization protein TraN
MIRVARRSLLAVLCALGLSASAWCDPAVAQSRPVLAVRPADTAEPEPTGPEQPGLPETPAPAPQQLCAADLDGNGDASGPGETAYCNSTTSGGFLCPIQEVACVADPAGQYSCPSGPQFACQSKTAGGPPSCSPNQCADLTTNPIVTDPPIADAGPEPNGAVDADGDCLGTITIFSGRGMRCRAPGLSTTLADCCKDKGKIVKDGMGSSLASLGTKIAVAKGVFSGMSAAFAAFSAGASAGEAASAGAHMLIVGLDPTSIAISIAINLMVEFLFQGCDQQDMETAMLNGSGMCHEVGSYCASSFLGICLQKARGHCCFNTKLGRIIQEQGRPQLKAFNGNLWGTPKNPMCRGFTPDEFQALDFSKMDLSEYYADIEARAQSDIQIDMKERVDAYLNAVRP